MTLARCPQVTGRIGVRVGLAAAPAVDVETLVAGVLERAPSKSELRIAMAATTGPGGLHALRRLLARAWMVARAANREAVTPEDITAADTQDF